MFIQYAFEDPCNYLWIVLIMVFSVCAHELAHAACATWQGDDTAKTQGCLTLNPWVHLGWFSLVILLITGMCWGQTPVNPSRFRHRYGEALVAFAGPCANLGLMLAFGILCWGIANFVTVPEAYLRIQDNILTFLAIAARMNGVMFLFNLLPIPPLDGAVILANLAPASQRPLQAIGPWSTVLLVLLFCQGGVVLLFGCSDSILTAMFSLLNTFC